MPAPPTTDDPPPHPDLAHEQAHLEDSYAALAAMATTTEAALDAARRAGDGGEGDSAIAAAHLAHRLRHLDPEVPGLVFGRIDGEDGATWHVGRRHVEDGAGDPLVVDWRAPVSVPFYRATPADPLDLALRRRFLIEGKAVTDLFDERFDDSDPTGEIRSIGIPDPLLAELERGRTGAMRDIVATIAAEQDEVIRADLATCLIVQGGPGTGKTAVGLHRAAFLLYEHREELDRHGVLVVGPNPVFLRYISQVLPSLGEAAARQTTMERLVGGVVGGRIRATDGPDRARLLGDARLAAVVARAVAGQRRAPTGDLVISTPWARVTLAAGAVGSILDEVAARDVPWSVGRGAVRTRVAALAVEAHRGRGPADEVAAAVRTSEDLRRALGRWWPSASPAALVRRLLTSPAALRRAGAGLLDPGEQALVLRPAAERLEAERWTAAEAVVVDEAVARVDGVPRTYGHVVADEAQDLSPMALRALGRRCPSGSMTILGDLAQATEPAAVTSWDETRIHLAPAAPVHREDLTVGYRVPAAVMDLADRLLPQVAPGLVPARSVRTGGRPPVRRRAGTEAGLAGEVVVTVRELAAAWASVGVIVPPAGGLDDAVAAALAQAGVAVGRGGRAVTEAPVSLVGPAEAKGLEFDGVVVVEPAAFSSGVGDEVAAGRLLYIALTRAVQELVVVYHQPLPPAMA